MFCDVVKLFFDAYILRAISDKISDGLRARYMLYRGMPLDLVIGECLVGRTLVITSDGTPSRQNLGPSGPQRSGKRWCVIGNAPAASVKRDTLVHNQNRNMPSNWWLIDFRWLAIWKWIERECYKKEDSTRKSHSSIQAGDTLKKVAMLTKRNAEITASHFVIVFTAAVNRKSGGDEILYWE